MKLSALMTINSVIATVFGVAFILVPVRILSVSRRSSTHHLKYSSPSAVR